MGERDRERERESELGKGSVYDPQILDEYFNSRPLKVTARIGEILAATSRGLLASVALPQQKRFSAYRRNDRGTRASIYEDCSNALDESRPHR